VGSSSGTCLGWGVPALRSGSTAIGCFAVLYLLIARGTGCPVGGAFLADYAGSVLPCGLPVQVQLKGLLVFKLRVWPAVLCCKRDVLFVWCDLSCMWNCLLRLEDGFEGCVKVL